MIKFWTAILDWFSGVTEPWESKGVKFTVYTTIAILIGGMFELIPPFFLSKTAEPLPGIKPYTALELAGRDIYQREGCFNCHTQMIRPFKWEIDRFDLNRAYGADGYSKAGEYVYEHPFLWGSKRTGPDLSHESQNQPSASWQEAHLKDPRSTSPGSVMPSYAFLFEEGNGISPEKMEAHMRGLASLGVPYEEADYATIAKQLEGKTEGDAVVAYLLKLGRDVAALKASGE